MSHQAILNGIDVLLEDDFRALRDLRVAVVANHSSITLDGRRTVDVLAQRRDLFLTSIFSPEHGPQGNVDATVGDSTDERTGLPIYSLYGGSYRPTPQQLHQVDAVLYDLQDVGCRFYTYITTLGLLLEACGENGVAVYVLDRPNPIGGLDVEGPCSDSDHESFVAYHELPLRHGMTVGELARLFNAERNINAQLKVVTMGGWQRSFWHHNTGQRWIDPSPNIRDVTAALLFPGVGLIEGSNVSVGRGTGNPFHVFGAPWMDGEAVARAVHERTIPGLRCESAAFTPQDSVHRHYRQPCSGVHFIVEDEQSFSPAALGLAIIEILRERYPDVWEYRSIEKLLGRSDLIEAIEDRSPELETLWKPDPDFFEARARALLYG
ncbi:MAG: exo-beta-N-acetylmuramidase NamZ family protein [Candidatus Eremiobacter antarcticus]|nr:DUF1343 domain-containing protein [Candidatus Eremiobacteraeota bacterium]MBC5807531.1 DUF1343 domain-containing protein [Candidatus Eremiobacteraeota bacterium]